MNKLPQTNRGPMVPPRVRWGPVGSRRGPGGPMGTPWRTQGVRTSIVHRNGTVERTVKFCLVARLGSSKAPRKLFSRPLSRPPQARLPRPLVCRPLSRPPQAMSDVETGQMSAVETGQMSAVETRQMSTVATERCPVLILYICLVSTADVCPDSTADISISIDHSASAFRINNQHIMEVATAADLTQASIHNPWCKGYD